MFRKTHYPQFLPVNNLSVVRSFGAYGGADWRRVGLVLGLMLCGELAVLQAAMLDGLSLDPLALFEDGIGLPK